MEEFSTKDGNIHSAESSVPLTKSAFILVFMSLMLSIFVSALDSTILSTALGKITSEFKALNSVTWVASSYLLSSTAFRPLYGKFSDIFGRKNTTLFALSVFLIGSILCGISQNIIMLIVFRALAGIGGGGLNSLAFIVISDIVAIEKRGIYMGIVGINFAIASVVGPLLGGILTDKLSWRWCFYINIPVCLVAMSFIFFFLKLPTTSEGFWEKFSRIDYFGSLSFLISISLAVTGLNWAGQDYAWDSAAVISTLSIAFVFLLVFVHVERKIAKEPIIPGKVLVRNVISANVTAFCNGAVYLPSVAYVTLYYQIVHQESIIMSGLRCVPLLLGVAVFSMISGVLMSKTGFCRPLSVSGTLFGLLGTLLLGFNLRPGITYVEEFIYVLLIGIGYGLCIQTNTIVSQASVEVHEASIVTSMVSFCQSMGAVIGFAILGTVYQNVLKSQLQFSAPEANITELVSEIGSIIELDSELQQRVISSYIEAFRYFFLVSVGFFAFSFISSLFLKPVTLRKK